MKERTFEELKVGEKASLTRRITNEDVLRFADLTGDRNPLHVDEDFAKKTIFKGRVAHGMLIGGLISSLLASELPGPGYVYVSQTLRFLRSIRLGESATVTVELIKKDEAGRLVEFRTTCTNGRGEVAVDGVAAAKSLRDLKAKE